MTEAVYTPDLLRSEGLRGWSRMARELWSSRELIWRLVLRDLQSRYGRSLFSYLWLILLPAMAVAVPMVLVGRRVLPMGETPLPYPAFVMCNIIVWQLFAGIVQSCAASLGRAGALVTRMNFPKAALVISAAGQPLAEFLVKLPLVAVALPLLHANAGWASAWALLLAIPIVLLGVGAGFVLSLLGLVVRDVLDALPMVLLAGMFLSPVLYPAPVRYPFYLLNLLNPVSPILNAQASLLGTGSVPEPHALAAAILFAGLVFLAGWRIFHVCLPRIAERA